MNLVVTASPRSVWGLLQEQGLPGTSLSLVPRSEGHTVGIDMFREVNAETWLFDLSGMEPSSTRSLLEELVAVSVDAVVPKIAICITESNVVPPRALVDDRHELELSFSGTVENESYGCPVIGRHRLTTWSRGVRVERPARTHGPSVTDGPRLWDRQRYEGLGRPVATEHRDVVRHLSRAYRGEVALPLEPGIASLLPRRPVTLPTADGGVSTGVLFRRLDPRPEPFGLLDGADLLTLLGFPSATDLVSSFAPSGEVAEVLESIRDLVSFELAVAIVGVLSDALTTPTPGDSP